MKLEVWEVLAPFAERYDRLITTKNGSYVFTSGARQVWISLHRNGTVASCVYKLEDEYHRPVAEGPAYEASDPNGVRYLSEYYEHGKKHKGAHMEESLTEISTLKVWWVLGWDKYYPRPDNYVASFFTKEEAEAFIVKKASGAISDTRSDHYEVVNVASRLIGKR